MAPLSKTLAAVLTWLHAGYPDGVPATDYFPLLALLNRDLTPEEVREVAASLMEETDEVTRIDIAVAVTKLTDEMPSVQDVQRVARRLAAAGMPPRGFRSDPDDAEGPGGVD